MFVNENITYHWMNVASIWDPPMATLCNTPLPITQWTFYGNEIYLWVNAALKQNGPLNEYCKQMRTTYGNLMWLIHHCLPLKKLFITIRSTFEWMLNENKTNHWMNVASKWDLPMATLCNAPLPIPQWTFYRNEIYLWVSAALKWNKPLNKYCKQMRPTNGYLV